MAVMISSDARLVSRCGVSPGSRWKSENAMARAPAGPATCTLASSAASATHMSEGCVAMQASLVPKMALMRLMPLIAEQPLPGCALVAGRRRVVEVKAPRALQRDCRRSMPCCAVAATRRPGSRSRAADSAVRSTGDRRGRSSAPARRCASRRPTVSSMFFSGNREMSISRAGRSTSYFIRSIRLVPPAMNFAAGSAAIWLHRVGDVACARVLERDHDRSIACWIAATMFG